MIFSFFLPGYNVHLQLLPLRFCRSFVLFSDAKRESFEFLVWIIQTVSRWNPCFRKNLHFFVFFCNGGARDLLRLVVDLSVSLTMSRPAETTLKIKHVKTWVPNSGFAKFQRFWSDFLFFEVLFSLTVTVHEGYVQLMLLGSLCSTPLFFRFKAVNAAFYQLDTVNAVVFPVQRR